MKCDSDKNVLCGEQRREHRHRTKLQCRCIAMPANTHNFRCCWNNNNNGRKRMKMDWNKITKNVNNKRNETNDVNEASK